MIYRRIAVALAAAALLACGGCKAASSAQGGTPPTVVVPGATNASVTCSELPYDYSIGAPEDQNGSGITVTHGLVRGSIWVTCTYPYPDTFQIVVILIRDGQEIGTGSPYTGKPNEAGYEAYTFVACVPGTYKLYYRYIWSFQGGVQQNTKTTTAPKVVTRSDCDA